MIQRAIQSANRFCKKLINKKNYAYSFLGYVLFSLFKCLLGTFLLILPSALITAITLLTISALIPILGGLAGPVGLGITLFLSVIFIKAISPLLKDIFEPYQSINLKIKPLSKHEAVTDKAIRGIKKDFSNEAAPSHAQKITLPTKPAFSLSMFNSNAQESATLMQNEGHSLRLS